MVEATVSEPTADVDNGNTGSNGKPKRTRATVQRTRARNDNVQSAPAPAASGPPAESSNVRQFKLTDAERERERERYHRRKQRQQSGSAIPTEGGITAEVHSSSRVGRPRKNAVVEFLDEGASASMADRLVGTLNFAAGALVGPGAIMNQIESVMVAAPLTNMIKRTPVGLLERSHGWLDPVTLIVALLIWGSRVSSQIRQKPKMQAAAQVTDSAAPATVAPPASTVANGTAAGDQDGIATPIPDVIRQNFLVDQ